MTHPKISLFAAALLAGCSSLAPGGANPPAPAAPVSVTWSSPTGEVEWVSADARRAWQAGQWWTLFDDATLNELMPRVEVGNQNLAQMVANVAQAQAMLRQAE
ncbi:MAG: RND transporter, partial [Burkholderiaceae bacterium]|nr:RND transporter [Burkholderiaceae bacterium]